MTPEAHNRLLERIASSMEQIKGLMITKEQDSRMQSLSSRLDSTIMESFHLKMKKIIRTELIKVIGGGAIIVGLGLWLKYLLENKTKEQEKEKSDTNCNQELFSHLKAACRTALEILRDSKTNIGSFSTLFTTDKDYEELLDIWQLKEPNSLGDKALQAYRKLEKRYKNEGENLNAIRDEAEKEVVTWQIYFKNRYLGIKTDTPKSWQ